MRIYRVFKTLGSTILLFFLFALANIFIFFSLGFEEWSVPLIIISLGFILFISDFVGLIDPFSFEGIVSWFFERIYSIWWESNIVLTSSMCSPISISIKSKD